MAMTYKDAGVDVAAGNAFVERIKDLVASTARPGVAGGIGGFGGTFAPDITTSRKPLLVAGADGVGTKLRIAFAMDIHDTVGIDLVAMCANDVVTTGAEPLFFLDYLATGKLEQPTGLAIVEGVATGCRQAGCALLGGETAEMPGSYPQGEYDLAGFCVGMVEAEKHLEQLPTRVGDVLVGLPSSGVHSNGFSLVRKVLLDHRGLDLQDTPAGLDRPLGEVLLEPTTMYVKPLLEMLQTHVDVRGAAHITGGGPVENIPRMLTSGQGAQIDRQRWPVPPIFGLVQRLGDVPQEDMDRTFNLGLGMVLAVARADVERTTAIAGNHGLEAVEIGEVVAGEGCLIR